MSRLTHKSAGFTLIELIITMTISAIIAAISAELISQPVESYNRVSKRSDLVSMAQSSINRISREIQGALPNSVRVGCSNRCIEFLHTSHGGRYRATAPGNILSFADADNDTSFEVLAGLNNISTIATGIDGNDCKSGLADCLVIYNTGNGFQDAYLVSTSEANVATISSITPTQIDVLYPSYLDIDSNLVTQQAFPAPSNQQRFAIVDTPIIFYCDNTTNTLHRYADYPISSTQHTEAQIQAMTTPNAMMAEKVTACSFIYNPTSSSRNGLVTIQLSISETMASGHEESITLINQVHTVNSP